MSHIDETNTAIARSERANTLKKRAIEIIMHKMPTLTMQNAEKLYYEYQPAVAAMMSKGLSMQNAKKLYNIHLKIRELNNAPSSVKASYHNITKNRNTNRNAKAALSSKLQNINPNIVFDFTYKQFFYIMTKNAVKYGQITDFNLDNNILLLNGKEIISFDDIINIQTKQSLIDLLVDIISNCMKSDNFKESFEKIYGENSVLHNLKYDRYADVIKSFDNIENKDGNLKSNLASAIQIMANYHENPTTKKSLEALANQYHWAWKRWGGTRRRKHLKKRKTHGKRTHRNKK